MAIVNFTKGQPLAEAVGSLSARTPIGAVLSSAEWAEVPVELRRAAFFSAGVSSVKFLDELKKRIQARLKLERSLGGDGVLMDRSLFVKEMREVAASMGISSGTGDLTDVGSERRLRLIWDTQMRMAQGYARRKAWTGKATLNRRPAAELVRVSPRRVPRDWNQRWEDALGRIGDAELTDVYDRSGRMVALVTSPIWKEISRFGNAYEPFDFNSGMGMRRVRRTVAERLGLLTPSDVLEGADDDEELELKASIKDLSPEGRKKLEAMIAGGIKVSGEFVENA